MIRKVGSKHLIMNILAAVPATLPNNFHLQYYCNGSVIMSKINPTDHKSITARLFPDEGFRKAFSELVESERDSDVEAKLSIMDLTNSFSLCLVPEFRTF